MEIHESMSKREVCSIEADKIETPLSVTINYMKVVPNDFIHIPQIYFCAWKKSNSYELTLTGSIITTVGLICFIAAVIIFFSMMFDNAQWNYLFMRFLNIIIVCFVLLKIDVYIIYLNTLYLNVLALIVSRTTNIKWKTLNNLSYWC